MPARSSLRKPLDFKYSSNPRYLAILGREAKLKDQQRKRQLLEDILETVFNPDHSRPIMDANDKINLNDRQNKITLISHGFIQDEGKAYFQNSLKIKEIRSVDTGGTGKLYLIEDTNANKFLIPENGTFLAVGVATDSGDYFIKINDRFHPEQLVSFIKKAWDDFKGPKGLKLEGKFLYTSAFSPETKEILANRLIDNPTTAHLSSLILKEDRYRELRLSGAYLLTNKYDAGGMYHPVLQLILWALKHDGKLPNSVLLAHEFIHHILKKNPELANALEDYIKKNHIELLKEIKKEEAYQGLDETGCIHEAIAYLFETIAAGSAKTSFGMPLYYTDIKIFKSYNLLPEAYFSDEVIKVFEDGRVIRAEFFEILKSLHASRFENPREPLQDKMRKITITSKAKNTPIRDVLRIEELELLREKLKEAIGSAGLVDLIIENIANRGSLYIDETGQVRGNMAVLKLIAGINEIKVGQLLRPVLFHEKVHDLLDRVFGEQKKPFLESLERELSRATSVTSIGLMDDIIRAMEQYYGKFSSVGQLLEDFIANYYTYKFSGRDKDIFEREEMKRAGAILEENIKRYLVAPQDKKDLNSLFSIYGDNTKEAQIAKLKELFLESKVLGGKSGIKFEKSEGMLRINKALGRLFFKKYPIATFLRSMRHGGSIYDAEPLLGIRNYLEFMAQTAAEDSELGSDIKTRFNELCETIKQQLNNPDDIDKKGALMKLIAEVPVDKTNKIEKNVISDWENRLSQSMEVFKAVFNELKALEAELPSKQMENNARQSIMDDLKIVKKFLERFVGILEDGVNRTKGIIERKETTLGEIIEEAIAGKIEYLSGEGISVKFKKDENIPKVLVNPMHMRQIITNVLVNAAKLAKEARILGKEPNINEITINMKLSDNGKVITEITDNGLGFHDAMVSSKQEQDGSYEVIFSLNASHRKDGTGFGLAENDYLAMINNGSFQVFSRPSGTNRGSTFIIELEPIAGFATLHQVIDTFKNTRPDTSI